MTEPIGSQSNYRRMIPHWVNYIRRRHGLVQVERNAKVSRIAEERVIKLDLDDEFEHLDMSKTLKIPGTVWAGECLAAVPDTLLARQVVRLWMASPDHRKIIMKTRATDIGIGARWDESRKCWLISLIHTDGSL